MTAPLDSDAMRASLRLIVQIAESASSAPTASYQSIIARMETIATIALCKQPSSVVVNLAEAAVDLGILRSALRAHRINLTDSEGPHEDKHPDTTRRPEIAGIDRIVAMIDEAQAALGRPAGIDAEFPQSQDDYTGGARADDCDRCGGLLAPTGALDSRGTGQRLCVSCDGSAHLWAKTEEDFG